MLYHTYMKTFDNILNQIIKVFLALIICIMLIISALFVFPPVFAVNLFPNQPIEVSTSPSSSSGIYAEFTYSGIPYTFNITSGVDNTFCFLVPFGNNTKMYFVRSSTDSFYIYLYRNSGGYISNESTLCQTYNSTYDLIYGEMGTSLYTPDYSCEAPVFDSIDLGLAAVRNYIDNPPANDYEGFRLPAGYVAAIQGSNVSFDMKTDMPEYSSIKQWAYSTQRYGIESSLPSQASFDYDYGTRIIWNITGDTNLLGEGYHAASSLSATVGSGYLMLVNPAYYGSTANIMNADMFNGVVTLTNITGITSIRLYSLGSYVGTGGITSDYSTDSAIQNATVVATNGGFYIEGEDGTLTQVTDLPSFGDTSTDGSSSGLIAKFRAILEGLVDKIESLLIAPVEYINRLITAASNFFAWLSGLWSWLPPAVSGVLTSVLYIMAIVGALKILWR